MPNHLRPKTPNHYRQQIIIPHLQLLEVILPLHLHLKRRSSKSASTLKRRAIAQVNKTPKEREIKSLRYQSTSTKSFMVPMETRLKRGGELLP